MLRAEGKDNGVVRGGALQFEIEGAAETFAQRESPGAVQTGAEGRVNDELHAAGLIEETLHDERFLRRQCSERPVSGGEIIGELAGAGVRQIVMAFEPVGELLVR